MPLETLTWKMLPPYTVRDTSIFGILDAIYSCGTQTHYVDGTSKASSTTNWTWLKDNGNTINNGFTTAVHAKKAVANPSLLESAIIIIGSTASPSTLKYARTGGTEYWVASRIMLGSVKSPGAYSNWNTSVNPFTAGEFTGYAGMGSISSANNIMIFESQEAVGVFILNTSGNVIACGFSGALIDPISSDSANAESDGRLYGMTTNGSFTAGIQPDWLSFGTNYTNLFSYNSTPGGGGTGPNMACVFNPGLGTIRYYSRLGAVSPTTAFLTPAGDIPRIPIPIIYYNGSVVSGFCGQLREIYVTRSGAIGGLLYELGTRHGYFISSSTQSFNQSVLLKA